MKRHRKAVWAAALAVGAASFSSAVALADGDPLAAVKADIAKVESDVQAAHDTLVADAGHLESDAIALKGNANKDQVKTTIKADWEKLRSDRHMLLGQIQADRKALVADLKAARDAHVGKGEIRPLLQALRQHDRQLRIEVRNAIRDARNAVRELRHSFRSQPNA